jgi:hypothetical protein
VACYLKSNGRKEQYMTDTMCTIAKLSLASILVLSIAVPVQAQDPKQGDYYAPTRTPLQQASPAQEQQIKQGDYYNPTTTAPQNATPAEQKEIQQGDYYKPGGK